MYCPKCKNEYVEGVLECPDCKVSLVMEMIPAGKPDYTKRLKVSILFAIGAICYGYVLHFVGTFFVQFFHFLIVARITSVLHLIFSLLMIFFYITFLRGYVRGEQKRLKVSTVLVIIGDIFVSYLFLKGVLSLFLTNKVPFLQESSFVEPIIPWVSSLFLLIFFINFYKDSLLRVSKIFSRSIFWAIFGSLIGLMIRTFMLYVYFSSGSVRWIFDLPPLMTIVLLPTVTFSFVTLIVFFILFYREL